MSRLLLLLGIMRWFGNRPRSRTTVLLQRGDTLVVGVDRGTGVPS